MDIDEFLDAIDIGYRTVPLDGDLLAVGEMGIADTTTAAMLCAALLGGGGSAGPAAAPASTMPGLPANKQRSKGRLRITSEILGDPLAVAAALGGRELAAIAGAVLAARATEFRCCSTVLSQPPPSCR